MFRGNVNYHPVYGVSLVIEEIDVSAMIEEAERRRSDHRNPESPRRL